MEAIEEKFLVVPFFTPVHQVTLTYRSVEEIPAYGHLNKIF